MKILHTADIHLGAKNSKLISDNQNIVKNVINSQIQELFEVASSQNYDAILICGDLFHSKAITNKIKNNFFESVENYSKPVIYVNGNHDEYFVYDDKLPKNFIFLNKDNPIYEYNNVCFWSETDENVLKSNFGNCRNNILLLHGNIENHSDNDFVDISKYRKFKFDYVAMGHIHQYKEYQISNTPYVYCGSLFSNGFDECGDKGFVEIYIDDSIKYNFKSFAKIRYMICNCDITNSKNYKDIIEKIKQCFNLNSVTKNDIIKVVLQGYFEESLDKNIFSINEYFRDYFFFTIEDKSKIKLDIEKYKNEKLSFKAEFINLVENLEIEDEIKNLMCQLGVEALKGEDLSI